MSDIRQWLDEQGLGQYANAFDENEIGLDLLSRLTDEALEKLGVGVMGHRIRILDAIATRAGDDRPPENQTAPEAAAAESVKLAAAERRQITVMFCDLVGSTALAEKLDPEDLREVMEAYQKAAGAIIERYEGHVAQYLGDGLMVYFGWPTAHEDDADRAVRSALEVTRAVKSVDAPQPLSVRTGIATGPVVVGETGDGDASSPKLAVGETPNIAARIQGLAKPNEIMIAPTTRRLVGSTFDVEDVGERALKGIAGPVNVWKVIGLAERRFEMDTQYLVPFVGREPETALLDQRWQQAKDSDGQVVLLFGEPGIGKSRIAQMLNERIIGEPHERLHYQCSPYHTNSAFYTLVAPLQYACGFERDDTVEQKLDKLESMLKKSGNGIAQAPLFAEIMSLPTDRYPPLNVSPVKQKELTIAAVADAVIGLASERPLLMILEDAQWIDPSTLETLGSIIDRIQGARVLLLITYRPEFEPPWAGYGHITYLPLTRLSRRQGEVLVEKVTGGRALPEEVLQEIIGRADGIPIFLEELTKTVIETGVVRAANGGYTLALPLGAATLPATLHGSLMARLDRCGSAKEIAQIGACIGRTFSKKHLASSTDKSNDELNGSIQKLIDTDVIYIRSGPSSSIYVFKHALIRDAAYGSLLKSRRREIHGRIAASLQEFDPDVVNNHPEVAAYHWTAAERPEQAVPHWLSAGRIAARRSANVEAITHIEHGLDLVGQLSDTQQRLEAELALRTALGPVLMWTKGWSAPEVQDNYDRLLSVSRSLDDDQALFAATWGIWLNRFTRGDIGNSQPVIDDLFAISRKDPSNHEHALQAHHAAWGTLTWRAEYAAVCRHAEDGLEIYVPELGREQATRYGGHDPGVCAHAQKGLARWFQGFPESAARDVATALELANRLGHQNSVLHASLWQGMLALFARDVENAEILGQRILELATQQGVATYRLFGQLVYGGGLSLGDQVAEGREQIKAAIAGFDTMGLFILRFMVMGFLADACRRIGDLSEAAKTIETAISQSIVSGDVFWLPELERIQGDILLACDGDTERTESCYCAAIRTADGHGNRAIELRATTSLARLWQEQDKQAEARELLSEIYDWFTEGFDTKDLKDAKALLEELA